MRFEAWRYDLPPFIAEIQGLSFREPWGRWSDGPVVEIRFARRLPARFTLQMRGYPFGPNQSGVMTVRMGKCETKVRLGDGASSLYAVDVANPERAYSLVLSIPNPVSPKALGMSDDARLLGFALKWLRIVPPPALMDRILAAVSRTR